MAWTVLLAGPARKSLKRIPAEDKTRILTALAEMEQNPFQGDIRKLTWAAYDSKVIKIRQRKTGAYVPVPVSDELKAELDAAPHRSPLIAVNSDGRPWTESGLQSAWRMATLRSGIVDRTFHDLRGTAVVRLARAGCTEAEIYAISRTLEYTGWNRRRAAQLLSISYRGILYKIRQHNLTPRSGREMQVLEQTVKVE